MPEIAPYPLPEAGKSSIGRHFDERRSAMLALTWLQGPTIRAGIPENAKSAGVFAQAVVYL
jgi:hypothetical protein